jgi:hypothetical protein
MGRDIGKLGFLCDSVDYLVYVKGSARLVVVVFKFRSFRMSEKKNL